jgi:hypothetical protein
MVELKLAVRAGDRVKHLGSMGYGEVLKVRGETAIVLWDSGIVDAIVKTSKLIRLGLEP